MTASAARRLGCDDPADPAVVGLVQLDVPRPGAGEVLVEVGAALEQHAPVDVVLDPVGGAGLGEGRHVVTP